MDIRRNGASVYRDLEGSYVVVAYDKPAERLMVVQQPLALIPVYMRETAHGIALSTSILALAPLGRLTLDEFAFQSQYRLGHRLAPYTLFSEIRSIPPWHSLEIHNGRATMRQIWAPVFPTSSRPVQEDVGDISRLLIERTKGLIPSGASVICDLTGGYDSRMTSAVARAAEIPFSVAVTGYPDHPDVLAAEHISRAEGLPIKVQSPVPPPEAVDYEVDAALLSAEGCLDAFHFTRTIHAKLGLLNGTADAVTVTGIGGEFFRDFNWAHEFTDRGRKQPASIDRLIRYRHDADSHPMEVFASDWHQAWRSEYKGHLEQIVKPYLREYNTAQIDAIFLHKLSGLYGVPMSATQGLSMISAPLLSLPALERSLAVRPQLKYGGRFQRRIIDHLDPALARHPTLRGCPAAPLRISNAHRFLPRIPTETKRLIRKLGSVWFGRNWFPVYTEPPLAKNPFDAVLAREMAPGGHLHYPSMVTGKLYRPAVLNDLLAQSRQPEFRGNRILSFVYTAEVIMRKAGGNP